MGGKEGRWELLSDLLAEASDRPRESWRSFLQSRTDDRDLVDEVLSLLDVPVPEGEISIRELPSWVGTELDTADAEPRLRPGEVVDGRFVVEKFVGRGGMGEVYAAQDETLRVRVALKILHPDLAEEEAYLSRFKREIGLAREITHPNVARVFDIGREWEHGGRRLFYFAMELLEGETLAARIGLKGKLDPAEALGIARQMAKGLGAAHAARVVHRDFKPSNVMLAGERVVITDFGLAVPVREGEDRSTTSLRLGTPGYVAPEQWAGKSVTAASDIYALGIVLHEMVTGWHPSDREGGRPPGNWERVIGKCLEMEPRLRWGSAEEAVAALDGGVWRRRETLWWLGGLAAAAAVGVVASRSGGSWLGRPGRVAKLLVAPVQNLTGDKRFDGATALLQSLLDQSPQLQLVTAAQRDAAVDRMGLAAGATLEVGKLRELAWRLGVPAVLHGTMAAVGGDYVLTFVLETLRGRPDAVGWKTEKTFRASGAEDMLGQFRLAGEWVRGEAGETLAQIAEFDRPPQEVSTGSWEALAAYSRAVLAWRRGDPDELAEQLLKEALAADPGFVAAQQELADFYISKARFAEGHEHWGKAMDLLSRRRVTFRERYRLETLYFEDSYQLKRQLESAQAWAVHYPGDESAQYFQGSSLFHHHRYAEAQRAFEAAWSVQPLGRTAGYLVALGWMTSDAGLSDRWLAELKRLGNEAQYLKWLGQTCFLGGEYGKAFECFRGASESGDAGVKDQALAYLTCLYAECGRYDLAVRHCRKHLAEARRWGRRAILARRLLHLAYLELATGDGKSAARAAREAATGETGPQAVRELATYYRLTKDLAELERLKQIARDWPLLPLFTGVQFWVDGEMTYLKAGPVAAEGLYLKALEVASPYMWPPVAIGTGLDLWRSPSHVRREAVAWYLAQRHWPGQISGSMLMDETVGKMNEFGKTIRD